LKKENAKVNGLMCKEKEEKKIHKYKNKKQRKRKATNRSVWKKEWRRTERHK